jgi:hypothetical protein
MSTTIKIFVDDIAAILASYDVIRVRKGPSESGPWTELTAAAAAAALLTGTENSPFDVANQLFQFQVDRGAQQDVTFSGTNPMSIALIVDQINAAVAGLASDDGGKLALESLTSGTLSRLDIIGGASLTELGFTAGDVDIGEEAYETLQTGISNYTFIDRDGVSGEYYQAAFHNTSNGQTSAWSEPFLGEPGTAVDASRLSVGSVDLIGADGVAKPDQRITFFPMYDPLEVDGFQVALVREPLTIITNNSGHAEITLVRGLRVKVVFEGTNYIRDITIPDAATFNIQTLMAVAPDPFNPHTPNYPTAPRRTI